MEECTVCGETVDTSPGHIYVTSSPPGRVAHRDCFYPQPVEAVVPRKYVDKHPHAYWAYIDGHKTATATERERARQTAVRIHNSMEDIIKWAESGSMETAQLKSGLHKINKACAEILGVNYTAVTGDGK